MISVIIPYRPDNETRERSFNYISNQYKNLADEVIIGEDNSGEKSFCRAHAINNGVRKSSGDILVIADADILIFPSTFKKALTKLPFTIPFGYVIHLNHKISDRIMNNEDVSPVDMKNNKKTIVNIRPGESNYGDKLAGGIQFITRELFDRVNGYDERFIGWGHEDTHFCCKIKSELGDYEILEEEEVYHLWHPRYHVEINPDNKKLAVEEARKVGIKLP